MIFFSCLIIGGMAAAVEGIELEIAVAGYRQVFKV